MSWAEASVISPRVRRRVGGLLLVAGIFASIVLAPAPGTLDVTNPRYGFLSWMNDAVEGGITGGYRARPFDYPPGTKVLLGAAGSLGDRVGISRATSLKVLLVVFHWLTFGLVLVLSRDLLLAGAVYLFTTLSTVALGYLDILYAPFLMASIIGLVRGRPLQTWAFLCIACVIKPQPLILLPFCLVYLGRLDGFQDLARVARNMRMWRTAALTGAAALLLVLAFGRTESDQWAVIQAYGKATAHNEVSGQALNAGWIGSYVYQVAKYRELGPARMRSTEWTREMKIGAASIVAWMLWLQLRRPKTPQIALLAILAGYLAYFTFNAGVHENHLFIAMLVALVLALWPWTATASATTPKAIAPPAKMVMRITLAIVLFGHLNVLLFYGWTGDTQPPVMIGGPEGLDASVPLSLFSIAIFVATVRSLLAMGRALPSEMHTPAR